MKAIHGGKAADDKIDSGKIAHLLRDYLNTVPHGPSRHISNVVSDDPFTPAGNCRLQHQFIVRIGDARTNPEPDGRQFSHAIRPLSYYITATHLQPLVGCDGLRSSPGRGGAAGTLDRTRS